jgi:hypothetical protein
MHDYTIYTDPTKVYYDYLFTNSSLGELAAICLLIIIMKLWFKLESITTELGFNLLF